MIQLVLLGVGLALVGTGISKRNLLAIGAGAFCVIEATAGMERRGLNAPR